MAFGKYSKLMVVMVITAALVLGGCAGNTPSVYAEIDGEHITKEDFKFYLNIQYLHDPNLQITKEDELDILDFMIEERLMLAEALKRGLVVDKEKAETDYESFRTQISDYFFNGSETAYFARLQELELSEAAILELIEDYQVINQLIDQERSQAIEPDDEAITGFYETEKESLFAHGERRKVRHILINEDNFPDADDNADVSDLAEELAQQLYESLIGGADFAELATENSSDEGSAALGGDIGFIERTDQIVPEFLSASFAAEIGVVQEPVQSTFGWHIIEVVEIEDSGFVELDDLLYDQISMYLYNEDKDQRVDTLIATLHAQADIKVNIK